MIDYIVQRIPRKMASEYICEHHYSHGCSRCASPCYGLFDGIKLIGVLMFACPCSENVRASVFGIEHKDSVTELHRLHILDCTPKNTESWFISRCLSLLKKDSPKIKAVISFSDTTEGHNGTIYQASNFYRCGTTGTSSTFYVDDSGRLHHPRQCGHNVTLVEAEAKGWKPVKRSCKNRYLYLVYTSKKERKELMNMCRFKEVKGGTE